MAATLRPDLIRRIILEQPAGLEGVSDVIDLGIGLFRKNVLQQGAITPENISTEDAEELKLSEADREHLNSLLEEANNRTTPYHESAAGKERRMKAFRKEMAGTDDRGEQIKIMRKWDAYEKWIQTIKVVYNQTEEDKQEVKRVRKIADGGVTNRQSKILGGFVPNPKKILAEILHIGRADIRPLLEHLALRGMKVDAVLAREDMFFDYNTVSKNLSELKEKNRKAGTPLSNISITSSNSVHDAAQLERNLPGIIIDSILSRP